MGGAVSNGGSFNVTSDQDGRRLDRVLRGLFPSVPLGAIMRAIRQKSVRVDGRRASGDTRLTEGSRVDTPWAGEAREPSPRGPASNRAEPAGDVVPPLRTLYRDERLWAVDKPVGLLSQPDREGGPSLITSAWRELNWSRADFRPALIGRLDRNVSGASLIALDAPTLRAMSELIRRGEIRKFYVAVTHGEPPIEAEIDKPLLKNPDTNTTSVDSRGRPSLSRIRRLETIGSLSLVEIELATGRPHQARVHLASIGCPILGDAKYGQPRPHNKHGRIFLHAHRLILPDDESLPENLRGLRVTAPIPHEFRRALSK